MKGWIGRQPIRTSQKHQLTVSRMDCVLKSTQTESADQEALLELTALKRKSPSCHVWNTVLTAVALKRAHSPTLCQCFRSSLGWEWKHTPSLTGWVKLVCASHLTHPGEIHHPKSKKWHHVHSWDLWSDRASGETSDPLVKDLKVKSHEDEYGCPRGHTVHVDRLCLRWQDVTSVQADRTSISVGTRPPKLDLEPGPDGTRCQRPTRSRKSYWELCLKELKRSWLKSSWKDLLMIFNNLPLCWWKLSHLS